jgi:hypothetical protein
VDTGPGGSPAGRCDACGTVQGPLVKLSLGRDFFGRAYDRLSPSSDQSPKWYCETCSMHKNLQRDFRDIRVEFDKLGTGQPSELTATDHLQRAQLRLREIAAILRAAQSNSRAGSHLLNPADVTALIDRFQTRTQAPPAAG